MAVPGWPPYLQVNPGSETVGACGSARPVGYGTHLGRGYLPGYLHTKPWACLSPGFLHAACTQCSRFPPLSSLQAVNPQNPQSDQPIESRLSQTSMLEEALHRHRRRRTACRLRGGSPGCSCSSSGSAGAPLWLLRQPGMLQSARSSTWLTCECVCPLAVVCRGGLADGCSPPPPPLAAAPPQLAQRSQLTF